MPIPTKTCPSCQANNILLKAEYCQRCGYQWPGLKTPINKAPTPPAKNVAIQIIFASGLIVVALMVWGNVAKIASYSRGGDRSTYSSNKHLSNRKEYIADDLGIRIQHDPSIYISQIGIAHVAYELETNCTTSIEFTTAPKLWEPPYFKILESEVTGDKKNYGLPGITGINTIDSEDGSSWFYGEITSSPTYDKVLQVVTIKPNCKDLQFRILDGLSAK